MKRAAFNLVRVSGGVFSKSVETNGTPRDFITGETVCQKASPVGWPGNNSVCMSGLVSDIFGTSEVSHLKSYWHTIPHR